MKQSPDNSFPRKVLHVGCGTPDPKNLHSMFQNPAWEEVRLDIDQSVRPDIVASLIDMHMVASQSMDAIYSSHNLEHLYPHEVPSGLSEFYRVLKPSGFALITLPDLQAVAKLIAADKLDEPAYQSPAGPITPLDILYGHRASMAGGNLFMAHKTGFTATTLSAAIFKAGFTWIKIAKNNSFSLWAKAYKTKPEKAEADKPL